MNKSTSWGIFKGTHNGQGLYWHGATNTYNVEGYGYFKTKADAISFTRRQMTWQRAHDRLYRRAQSLGYKPGLIGRG